MSGHHPFSNLTKDFTAEDWQIIEEMKAELRADIERREALEAEATRKDPDKAKQPQPAEQ